MRRRGFIFLLSAMLASVHAPAQEIITGLSHNRQLAHTGARPLLKGAAAEEPLLLPFSDDFSSDSLYPSTARWTDILVFVNNTFSVRQPSQGVATFDCLDERGNLYATANQSVFAADRLTSRDIDLEYLPADSIWLSFLYEAGGIADRPESSDSLTLSFWAPASRDGTAYGGLKVTPQPASAVQ